MIKNASTPQSLMEESYGFLRDYLKDVDVSRFSPPVNIYVGALQKFADQNPQLEGGKSKPGTLVVFSELLSDYILARRQNAKSPNYSLQSLIITDASIHVMHQIRERMGIGIELPDDANKYQKRVYKALERSTSAVAGWPHRGTFLSLYQARDTIQNLPMQDVTDQAAYDALGTMNNLLAMVFNPACNATRLHALHDSAAAVLALPITDEIKPFLQLAYQIDGTTQDYQQMINATQKPLSPELKKITLIPPTQLARSIQEYLRAKTHAA